MSAVAPRIAGLSAILGAARTFLAAEHELAEALQQNFSRPETPHGDLCALITATEDLRLRADALFWAWIAALPPDRGGS
ncbi:MAG: hypothetical protein KGH75_00910 [Rhodospirillales bacterium]|nr:hypothetical protein [Rhodospirillales bacterium]